MFSHGFESIHDLFSQVSSSYDTMNDIMSLGIHHLWKAEFVDYIKLKDSSSPLACVDMACGTGDVGLRLWDRAVEEKHHITLLMVDPNELLLDKARQRANVMGIAQDLHWMQAQVLDATIAPNSIDIYTMSFGLRNMAHRADVLRRVWTHLRCGGVFYCLEFSHPQDPTWQRWYHMYLQWLPVMGKVVANNAHAYSYLRDSIHAFPPAEQLVLELEQAGFVDCFCRPMTQGVVAITGGTKP